MERTKALTILVLAVGLLVWSVQTAEAEPIGTAFTYQGRLMDNNDLADGPYDFEFNVYDSPVDGNLWGGPVAVNEVDVVDGYFTAIVDFGEPNAFLGEALWLEIGVRPGELADPNEYRELSPRGQLMPAPFAHYARYCDYAQTAGSDDDWAISGNNMYSIPDGYVGIGTNSPDAKLTVDGGILREGSTMYGANAETHINLGVSSITGTNGQDFSCATVGGGEYNTASKDNATVGGGAHNSASSSQATVGGGAYNMASSDYATIGGGYDNTANYYYTSVGGGRSNTASGNRATVGGGENNTASGNHATVGGGWQNTASGNQSTVCGGQHNTASGDRATVAGGYENTASGYYSFASGRRAKANDTGAFVWADSADANFASTGNNQFLIRASGGVGIGTDSPSGALDVNGPIYQRGGLLHADYVFEPDYRLESIEEHSKLMWQNKHLPAIPKARTDEAGQQLVEVGAHRKGIVEELEKAHIYIEQLNRRNEELAGRVERMEARLEQMQMLMKGGAL